MKKFARVGFEIAMFKSKLQKISLSVYDQPKSQLNFRKSQKISNIYLKLSLSYNSFNLLWVESTPPVLIGLICGPSLTPIPCTVSALSDDFTDKVILTDEMSTVRFVVARQSPLKEYRASIFRTPGDVTSRQES